MNIKVKTIEIPYSVKTIPSNLIRGNDTIERLILHNEIKVLPQFALAYASGIKYINCEHLTTLNAHCLRDNGNLRHKSGFLNPL